jgi:hypothetical protein
MHAPLPHLIINPPPWWLIFAIKKRRQERFPDGASFTELPAFLLAETASVATVAATTATTAAATAKPTATAATATALGARTSLADIESATVHLLAVKTGDGCIALRVVRHLHKAKAAGLAREFVFYDADFGNLAKSFEGLTEFILPHLTGKITDVDVH